MDTPSRILSDRYLSALQTLLAKGPEADFASAAKLGREALRLGVSPPDFSLIHEEALMALMPCATGDPVDMIQQTGLFFRRALVPLVKVPRVARAAKTLTPKMCTAATNLIVAKKHLLCECGKRKTAESANKDSRRQYDQLLADSIVMQKQLRHLTHELLRAQEDERKKISRELHDEISQILTGINVQLAALKIEAAANTGSVTRKIGNAQRLVEKSVAVIHRFARELRPAMLDDLGLIPALTAYMKEVRKRTGLQIRVTASKAVATEALDSPKRTVLYRIVQEALTNVAKHAQASQVTVSIKSDTEAIYLEVTDDGKSFSVPAALANKRCKHLGLIGMRERAEMVGGTFSVESEPGKGTTIRVRIPLHMRAGHYLEQ